MDLTKNVSSASKMITSLIRRSVMGYTYILLQLEPERRQYGNITKKDGVKISIEERRVENETMSPVIKVTSVEMVTEVNTALFTTPTATITETHELEYAVFPHI